MWIDRAAIDTLTHHAAHSQDEVCGVLVGRRLPQLVITGVVPGRNVHHAPRRHFLLDAATLLRADAQARDAGIEIVGFYHSHPCGGLIPSSHDRRDAWPDQVLLIVTGGALAAWLVADRSIRPCTIAPLPESEQRRAIDQPV